MSITHAHLVLPYCPSANRYWSSRVIKAKATGKWMSMTYVTPEAKAYREQVAWLVKAAGIAKPIAGRVAINVQLYPHRPLDFATRMRKFGESWDDTVQCIDLDNANKVLLDSLKGCAIDDDKWVRELHSERMEPDENGSRVVVRITSLATPVPQTTFLELASLSGPHQRIEVPAFADEGVDLSDGLPF